MKERPILFSGPMVRALLDGRKTQTRRVVKNQPPCDVSPIAVSRYHPTVIDRSGDEQPGTEIFGAYSDDGEWGSKCPYGEPGDRLWVREAWRTTGDDGRCDDMPPRALQSHEVWYEAAGTAPNDLCVGKYRPSMFMLRWASRITLEITGVRVERLQDISYEDALSEGVADFSEMLNNEPSAIGETPEATARRLRWPQRWFESLWTDINGADSWNANPLVWVIEFRRLSA